MANTALKKIVARVKQLRKKHPGAKYRTLQKQAGREFKSGKLKAKRKPAKKKAVRKTVRKAVTKKRVVRRKVVRRKARKRVASVGTVKRRRKRSAPRKRSYKTVKGRRYRRISGTGNGTILLVAGLAVVGLLAYLIMRPSTQTTQYMPTGNYTRDSSASSILTWATAANLGASAFKSILDAINGSTDAQVAAATSGGTIDLTKLRPPAGGIQLGYAG